MLIWTTLKLAIKSLLANKLRTLLAMLGIIIGVGAVISMLAIGAGARRSMMERIRKMGTNLLVVRPGGVRRNGVRSGSRQSLTVQDALAIVNELDGVAAVSPVVRGNAQVKQGNQNLNTSVIGASPTYLRVRNFSLVDGRGFSFIEEDRRARVAILGSHVSEELFPDGGAIQQNIRVGSVTFRVIGTLEEKGDQGWFNPDNIIIIPYTTAMHSILGQEYLGEINIEAAEGADLKALELDLDKLLRKRHHIQADQDADFNVRNQAEYIELAATQGQIFSILLGGIGGISLFVGGIGIMNIMLVTVTERTREIGVRKAIGARDRDILRQFILESVLLTGIGGIIGVGLGVGGAYLFNRFSPFPTYIEISSVILSVSVSAAIGVFFGFYPAWRAAKLDPIEALRYE